MCSDTIEVNGVWIAKLRATVNLAKKLKKEGEAKSQKRRSRSGDASASQIGNGISGNTADAGGQPSDTSSVTTSSQEGAAFYGAGATAGARTRSVLFAKAEGQQGQSFGLE